MSKSKFSRRITWRVILIMSLFNVLIIGAVILFDLGMSRFESKTRAQHLIYGISGKLEAMVSTMEIAATNNVAEIENNLECPEKVQQALVHELQLNPFYIGCAVAFEPDYYASQGRWYELYTSFSDSAHIEQKQIGSAQHDYFNQDWYQKGLNLEKGKGYLTALYLDKDGGKRIVSTYVKPIFDRKGRKVSVYGIDVNIDWLENAIINEENKFKEIEKLNNDPNNPDDDDVYFFIQIIDSKGRNIAGSKLIDDNILQTILKKDSIAFEKMTIGDINYSISSKRLANTDWTLVLAQHERFVLLHGYILACFILFFMTIGGIVIFFFMRHSIRRTIRPLRYLSDSAHEVAHGNFDTPLPIFKHQDEITELRDSFDTMQQSLKQYVDDLKEATAAKASIESELKVAHKIQISMLPKKFPPFPTRKDIELYGMLTPAKAVGGDLYDFFINDDKLFFCIGDVSGKGVPASLVMAVTRTLFRNVVTHTVHPSEMVRIMNNDMSNGNDEMMFVTLFVGVLDLKTGHLSYCNAGHEAPYIGHSLLSCHSNLSIGLIPDRDYKGQETEIAHGTTIFLYTDGLTEAMNANKKPFGKDRVKEIVTALPPDICPQIMIETMAEAVHQYVGDTEQSDDLTMLAIRFV